MENAKLSFFIGGVTKVCRIFAVGVALALSLAAGGARAQCGDKNFDEYGAFLGVGYYNGEINPAKPFYKPKPALGFNLRHVIDYRFAATFQAIWCKLEGSDLDFGNEYQRWRGASFENELVELSVQGEINFLPLVPGDPDRCFTPYIAAGPGIVLGSFVNEGLRFCIPFGVGVKYSPGSAFTLSAEWKYRRLFSDVLDGIAEDRYSLDFGDKAARQKSFLGNDDCYSFIGVVLSFRPNANGPHRCSAY